MRVVHVHARWVDDVELVDEEPAWRDRVLGDERHAIHVVRHGQTVEVQDRRLGHLVAEHDPHVVSGADPNLWARYRPVEAHRVDEHAGLGLPPDLLGPELEHLVAILDRRLERLVAEGVGLGGEGFDALPVAVEHLLDAHAGMRTGRAGVPLAPARRRRRPEP